MDRRVFVGAGSLGEEFGVECTKNTFIDLACSAFPANRRGDGMRSRRKLLREVAIFIPSPLSLSGAESFFAEETDSASDSLPCSLIVCAREDKWFFVVVQLSAFVLTC